MKISFRFSCVMTRLASGHGNRLLLGQHILHGDVAVTAAAWDPRLPMVAAMGEVDETRKAVNRNPLDSLLFLLVPRQRQAGAGAAGLGG